MKAPTIQKSESILARMSEAISGISLFKNSPGFRFAHPGYGLGAVGLGFLGNGRGWMGL